jgi:hypothetical protein
MPNQQGQEERDIAERLGTDGFRVVGPEWLKGPPDFDELLDDGLDEVSEDGEEDPPGFNDEAYWIFQGG